MNSKLLTKDVIDSHLKDLPVEWKIQNNHLFAEFQFKNFVKAFSFMTEIAFHSEALDHHPSLANTYNKVSVELWTHDANGITELDFELAKRISKITK